MLIPPSLFTSFQVGLLLLVVLSSSHFFFGWLLLLGGAAFSSPPLWVVLFSPLLLLLLCGAAFLCLLGVVLPFSSRKQVLCLQTHVGTVRANHQEQEVQGLRQLQVRASDVAGARLAECSGRLKRIRKIQGRSSVLFAAMGSADGHGTWCLRASPWCPELGTTRNVKLRPPTLLVPA